MHAPADLANATRHLKSIWDALADAAKVADSPLRTPNLATVGLDGSPRGRTVVLRSADATSRELRLFADARSPKIEDLQRDPRVAITFWDPTTQIQIRAIGECVRLYDDAAIQAAWEKVPESNRENYRSELPPGAILFPSPGTPGEGRGEGPGTAREDPHPSPLPAYRERGLEDGFDNFALLVFIANEFDWLWLDRAGHKRCRFDLSQAKAWRTWLVP